MIRKCPHKKCPFYQLPDFVIKDGRYRRKDDSRFIQRYRCKACGKRFSNTTGSLEMYQKKRRVNYQLFKLLSSGMSLRRCAHHLGINKNTVDRKLRYLGEKSRRNHEKFLQRLSRKKVKNMQFDDLITKENSKLKPLSVSIAVDTDRRFVLAAEVSQIPAFGHLAKISRKKYGRRKCYHREGLRRLFEKVHPVIAQTAIVKSDEHRKYPEFVQRFLPNCNYLQYTSERGCIAGQGELKKVRYDPLFAINHTCAMMRANINRLIRKTWCTTKDSNRLKDHLDLFICWYNRELLRNLTPF